MARIMQETRLDLEKSELVAVKSRSPLLVACEAGELWLTQEGSTSDVIMRAGERIAIGAHQEAVVSALRPARVLLVPERQDSDLRIRQQDEAQACFARLRRWRFPPLASFPATHLR